MFTIEKAEKLLDIAKREYPILNKKRIFIKKEMKKFCVRPILGEYVYIVYIEDHSLNKKLRKKGDKNRKRDTNYLFYDYLKLQYDLNFDVCKFYNFLEVFGFFHEIGHIYHDKMELCEERSNAYKQFREGEFLSHIESFVGYREIPFEKLADEFAVDIIKNNLFEIWSIMNNISIEEAEKEYNFWNNRNKINN